MTASRRSPVFEIERSTMSRAPKRAVEDRLLRPATWPRWQAEIISTHGPERIGPGDVVEGRAEMMGFDVSGQSVAREIRDGVIVEDVVVGVGMRITYELEEVPGGTMITHRLSSRLPEGTLGRLLSFFLRRRLRLMQRSLLRRLPVEAERDPG